MGVVYGDTRALRHEAPHGEVHEHAGQRDEELAEDLRACLTCANWQPSRNVTRYGIDDQVIRSAGTMQTLVQSFLQSGMPQA